VKFCNLQLDRYIDIRQIGARTVRPTKVGNRFDGSGFQQTSKNFSQPAINTHGRLRQCGSRLCSDFVISGHYPSIILINFPNHTDFTTAVVLINISYQAYGQALSA